MLRLKVSYKEQEQLEELLELLKPIVLFHKIAKEQKGEYKRAYITLDI